MLKKVLSLVIAVSLLVSVIAFNAVTYAADNIWDGTVAAAFAGGNGSDTTPYLISNGKELAYFAQTVNAGTDYSGKHFMLTADITLNDYRNLNSWQTTAPANMWTPIGNGTQNFNGQFNGDNHIIKGMYVNTTTQAFGGLFGSVKTGVVQNVRIDYSLVKCAVSAVGTLLNVGGLAGKIDASTVENCHNNATVFGYENSANAHITVGGLIGTSVAGIIKNSINTGSVTASRISTMGYQSWAGGILGQVPNSTNSTIENCYNNGTVEAIRGTNTYCAGIVSRIGASAVIVKNCYNVGAIVVNDGGAVITKGSIAGANSGTLTVTNCYALTGTADYLYGTAADGFKSEDELKAADFCVTLGSGFTASVKGVNDGYPITTAQAAIPIYDIVYDTNGFGIYSKTTSCFAGTDVIIDFADNPQSDYEFLGWATASDASEPEYTQDGVNMFTVSGNTTLYAVWYVDELTYARVTGTLPEYLAAKKLIVDVMNDAISTNNDTKLTEFLTQQTELSLWRIYYIDSTAVRELYANNIDKFNGFASRIKSYGHFNCAELSDLDYLKTVIETELAVGEITYVADVSVLKQVISENNAIYKLNITNAYYLENENAVLSLMLNRSFGNVADLNDVFEESYIMYNFNNTDSYYYIKNLVADSAEEIGYNQSKFNNIKDKNELAKSIIKNKASITSMKLLAQFIDNYIEEEEKTTTKSSSAGSGGGSGGRTISVPIPVATAPVDNGTVGNANEVSKAVVSKSEMFGDVPVDYWAYEPIRYLSAKGAASGYGDGTFRPTDNVTRAEFVKMLLNGFDVKITQDEAQAENVFEDINAKDWYYYYVKEAKKQGVVTGDSLNEFRPNDVITRSEMAAIVYRLVNVQNKVLPKGNEVTPFNDTSLFDDWAFSAISKMQLAGIVNGDENGNFNPNNSATRAEVAKIIYNTFYSMVTEGDK